MKVEFEFCELVNIAHMSDLNFQMRIFKNQFTAIAEWASDVLQVMFAEESFEILSKEFDIK